MEMWLKCMILLCAAYGAVSTDDHIDLTIKYITALDNAALKKNDADELSLMFEGPEDMTIGSIGEYTDFILQIQHVPVGGIPWDEVLKTTITNVVGSSKQFLIKFSYDGAGSKVHDLLGKKINLELIMKKVGGTATGEISANLEGKTAFPKSSTIQSAKTVDKEGIWLRIGDTNVISIVSENKPSIYNCNNISPAPCYIYENLVVNAGNTYYNCDDVTVDVKGPNLYLCSSAESNVEEITNSGGDAVIDQITLVHTGSVSSEAVSLEAVFSDQKLATKLDLVVHKKGDDFTTACTADSIPIDGKETVTCPTSISSEKSEYHILLAGYKGAEIFQWANDYTATNHVIDTTFITANLLETSWDKAAPVQEYYLSRNAQTPESPDLDAGYKEAYTDCAALGDTCVSYFTNVPTPGTYSVTVQDIIKFNLGVNPDMKDVSVRSIGATTPVELLSQKTTLEFRVVHAEPISSTVTENSIELDVCFAYITNTSTVNTHYEFLAVNEKGKWKKEIGYKKKDDSHACFYGLELPLADFGESSKFFVLLRDSNNGKSLKSGEVTIDLPALRAIKPEVDNNNNGSTSTLAIVGAAIGGIACLMALVAAAIMFVMKINRDNDGHQYPLNHKNIEDSNIMHGLDNPIPTM